MNHPAILDGFVLNQLSICRKYALMKIFLNLNQSFSFFIKKFLYQGLILLAVLPSVLILHVSSHAQETQQNTLDDGYLRKMVQQGENFLCEKKPKEAIAEFDKVIQAYEKEYKDHKGEVYCARHQTETLFYLAGAANRQQDAVVLDDTWAHAYYRRAFALVDLGQLDEAKVALQKAIALSPQNSIYLAELGHIFQVEKDWPAAIETFKLAEHAAENFSPDSEKTKELTRAWRGIGFALIETNRLDEAEEMYKKCLSLNPDDSTAQGELRYIDSLREKQKTP